MQSIENRETQDVLIEEYQGSQLTERMNDSLMKQKGNIEVKRTFFKDKKVMRKAAKKARKNNRRK